MFFPHLLFMLLKILFIVCKVCLSICLYPSFVHAANVSLAEITLPPEVSLATIASFNRQTADEIATKQALAELEVAFDNARSCIATHFPTFDFGQFQLVTDHGNQNLGVYISDDTVVKCEPLGSDNNQVHGTYLYNRRSFDLIRTKDKWPDYFVLPEIVLISDSYKVAVLIMKRAPGIPLFKLPVESRWGKAQDAYLKLQHQVAVQYDLDCGDRNAGSVIYDEKTGKIHYVDCGDWVRGYALSSKAWALKKFDSIISHGLPQIALNKNTTPEMKYFLNRTGFETAIWDTRSLGQAITKKTEFSIFDAYKFVVNRIIEPLMELCKEDELKYQDFAKKYDPHEKFRDDYEEHRFLGSSQSKKCLTLWIKHEQYIKNFWKELENYRTPAELEKFVHSFIADLAEKKELIEEIDICSNFLDYTVCSPDVFRLWLALHDKDSTFNISTEWQNHEKRFTESGLDWCEEEINGTRCRLQKKKNNDSQKK